MAFQGLAGLGGWFGPGGVGQGGADVTASDLIDQILARVRDPNAQMFARTDVLRILSECQRALNYQAAAVIDEVALVTAPGQVFYRIADNAPTLQRVLSVKLGTQDLDEVPWKSLMELDVEVLNEVAPQHERYALAGRDLLVIHPQTNTASALTLVGVKVCDALTTETQKLELRQDFVPKLLEYVELVLLTMSGYLEIAERMAPSG